MGPKTPQADVHDKTGPKLAPEMPSGMPGAEKTSGTERSGLAGGTSSGAATSRTGVQYSESSGAVGQHAGGTSGTSAPGTTTSLNDAHVGSTRSDFGLTRRPDTATGGEARTSARSNEPFGAQVLSASTLAGYRVVNGAGETLGDITEIMIDAPTGRVAYAVLSSGGFLGIGDKLFAIPWHALEVDSENRCFVLNVPKDRLERAPGFDKHHWPTMADATWAREVHSYYGSRPYWE